jgi:hypothetical protein
MPLCDVTMSVATKLRGLQVKWEPCRMLCMQCQHSKLSTTTTATTIAATTNSAANNNNN